MKSNYEYYQIVYPKIIESIRLAAPSEIQCSLFPQYIDPKGEIADIVEEAARYSRILAENEYMSFDQRNKIEELSKIFEGFDKADWTILAM